MVPDFISDGPKPATPATVLLKISTIPTIAVWDEGSPYTLVGPDFLEKFRDQGLVLQPLAEALTSANGTPMLVHGWVTVKLELPGKTVVHPVVVTHHLGHQCLLGGDLKSLYGVIVDPHSKSWYWKNISNLRIPFHNSEKPVDVNTVNFVNR